MKAVLEGLDPSKLGGARERSVRALGDVLKAYPKFQKETEAYLKKGSSGALFVKEIIRVLGRLGETLGEKEPVGTAKSEGDFFKRAQVLKTSLIELVETLKGRESSDLKFAASQIIGAVGRIEDIAELRKRGLPVQDPEGGVHAHSLLRREGKTRGDGAHIHILKLADGKLVPSREDGQHWHQIEAGKNRSGKGPTSNHTHIFDIDGQEVETKADGAHDHDLMVRITGFDGSHTHEVELDGAKLITMTASEFAALHPEESGEGPPVGSASEILKKEVFAVVSERFAVKDASDIFYYSAAIGPISKEEAKKYKEVVEIGDSLYTPIGKTFHSREKYERGDVIKVEVSDLFLDTSDDKIRVRWFTPVVLGKMEKKQAPSSTKEIIERAGTKTVKDEKVLELFDKAVTEKLPIFKRAEDDEERFVLGIVLKPEVPDSQKEIYSADEIRKTAHGFMEFHANMGRQHTANVNGRIKILESYLALADFEINGRKIKKGTWLLGMRIVDDGIWKDIKSGKLTGLSIGGTAVRIQNRAMREAA